jgi:acyl-CoA synthetase (AMP-forming)/AMP-acid ligase II
VSPSDLEGLLRTHPKIQDVAVLGIFLPDVGYAPRAFVVLKTDRTSDYLTLSQANSYLTTLSEIKEPLRGGMQLIDKIPLRGDGNPDLHTLKKLYYNVVLDEE